MVFEDGAIHFTEKPLAIPIDLVLPTGSAALHMHRIATFTCASITLGKPGLALFGQFTAKRLFHGFRYTLGKRDFIDTVTVAFEQAHRIQRYREDLVAIGGLRNAQQRLEMHAIVSDRQLRYAALQTEHLEIVLGAEHGQSVAVEVPEVDIIDQRIERLEQRFGLIAAALLFEGVFQLSHQVLEADGVLLALGKAAMGGLVQRQARRLALG